MPDQSILLALESKTNPMLQYIVKSFTEAFMSKQLDFTKGNILSLLMRFALPVLTALLLQAMYGAVDLIIVGKYAATADISAVATGSQLMQTVTGVLVGLSTGITVLVARRIGEKQPEEAGRVIGSGITLFAGIAISLTLLLVLFTSPICILMQTPEEAFVPTVSYVRICSMGTVFIIAFNVLGSIFRGIGDSKMPLITVSIATAANICGDLLLVAIFRMGAAGAAAATVFAQSVSVILSVFIIRRRSLPFTIQKKDLKPNKEDVLGILKLGVPLALQDLLVSVSFLVIMAIVNSLGVIKSAGVGVAEKLCAFVMLIPSAYSQAMSAFVAQNMGAEKPERANKALWYGIITSLGAGFLIGYISFFHGDLLAGIFANDTDVIQAAASYLKAYVIDCLLTSFLFCLSGYFSGLGNTLFVMIEGIIGAFCVRIPVSYFVSRIPDVELFYIGLATPASTLLQIFMCLVFYFYINKKRREQDVCPT